MDDRERHYRDYLIGMVERNGYDHQFLLEILWKKEFYSVLANDDNRGLDGLELRIEAGVDDPAMFGPCRVLEALIGLAKRYEFELYNGFGISKKNLYGLDEDIYDSPTDEMNNIINDSIEQMSSLFWIMLGNLGLTKYSRKNWNNPHILVEIDEIIERWLSRQFYTNGAGSPFRLKNPKRNMCKVEMWYQLQAYIMENHT